MKIDDKQETVVVVVSIYYQSKDESIGHVDITEEVDPDTINRMVLGDVESKVLLPLIAVDE